MFPKIKSHKLFAFTFAIVFALLLVLFVSPASSDWEGDIDDITQQLDRDFKFGGKEEIKAENLEQANTQLREDAQITNSQNEALSPLSGTYTIGVFTFNFVITNSGRFTALGTSSQVPSRTFRISGTVSGNQSTYTVTMTQQAVGPPFNLAACTQSTSATGVFSGSGEVGTTHSFTRGPLCFEAGTVSLAHVKVS